MLRQSSPRRMGSHSIVWGVQKEISGGMHHTTNNRMELFAVISGLGALKEPCNVLVHSDSTYVVDAFVKNGLTTGKSEGGKQLTISRLKIRTYGNCCC